VTGQIALGTKADDRDEELRGSWVLHAAEVGGEPARNAPIGLRVAIDGGRVAVRDLLPGGSQECALKVDVAHSPRSFNLTPAGRPAPLLGVYEVQGDELRACIRIDAGGGARPRGLATAGDDLFSFRRVKAAAAGPDGLPEWMRPRVRDGVAVSVIWAAETPIRFRDPLGTVVAASARGLFGLPLALRPTAPFIVVGFRIQNLSPNPLNSNGGPRGGTRLRLGERGRVLEDAGTPLIEPVGEAVTLKPGEKTYRFVAFPAGDAFWGPNIGAEDVTILATDGGMPEFTIPNDAIALSWCPTFPLGAAAHNERDAREPRYLDRIYFLEELPRDVALKRRFDAIEAAVDRAARAEAVRLRDANAEAERRTVERAMAKKRDSDQRDAPDPKAKAKVERDEAANVKLLGITGRGAKATAELRQLPRGKKVFARAGQMVGNGKWEVLAIDPDSGRVTVTDPEGKTQVLVAEY